MLAIAVGVALGLGGAASARAQAMAPDGPAARIAALLQALKAAPDENAAGAIEQRLRVLWAAAGSPAAVLLQARGMRDLVNHADRDAVRAFDAALVIDPGYAAGYAERAVARFRTGDVAGAITDIEAALRHDPSLFVVFGTLSRIAESRGDWQAALLAWRRYAAADPRGLGVAARLRRLERKALGERS